MNNIEEENLIYEINDNNSLKELSDIDSILNNETFFNNFYDQYQFFNEDNIMAKQIDYLENYNVKMLHHIANYYKIPKKKLKKEQLIQLIIEFENDTNNDIMVYNRKKMWHYMNELKNDTYFSKFVIFFNS
jgi:hypothetical protein